jgi:uncharacterized membrane protein YoaK (UPF0700 family)
VSSPQAGARSAARAARLPDPVMAPLVLLTVLAGVADAITYLELGRVFVANSTGNVVFLGFAAAGPASFRCRRGWWPFRRSCSAR